MPVLSFMAPVVAVVLLTASVLCFTPRYSIWRLATCPIIGYLTYHACRALDFFDGNQLFNPLTSGFVFGFAVHFFHLLCIAQIDDSDIQREILLRRRRQTKHDKEKVVQKDISVWTRLTCALRLLSTVRGNGTSYEIRGIRSPPEQSATSSSSRIRFLVRNVLIVMGQYLAIDLMTSQPPSEEDKLELFGPGREYLFFFRPTNLPPVTGQEVLAHLGIVLLAWGPIGIWFVDIDYRVTALVSVSLGISEPDEWLPLFGSIMETYTLRRFWGRFWHQLFRWPFQGITSYLCRDILHLPRPSLIERYLNIFLVFAISTVLHVAIDAKGGIGLDKTGAITCFLIQPVGIMLEDAVQAIFHRIQGRKKSDQQLMLWTRMFGYIWVWGFLTMVAPLYNFPLMRYQDPSKNGVPFSVVKHYLQ